MDIVGFTYLDYAVVAVLALSTLFAFVRGFIGSFLSLAGWIVSIYLSYTLFPAIRPLLDEKIKNPVIVMILGHSGLLVGFLIVFGIINIIASNLVKGLTSGIIDRTLGAAFGVIRGAIIISFLYLIVSTSISIFNGVDKIHKTEAESMPSWLKSSKSFIYMHEGSQVLSSFIPDSFYERFQEMYDDVSKKTMDDRFVENSIQKLRKSLSPNEVKLIDERTEEAALTQSSEEAKYNKLNELLNAYENGKVDKDVSGKKLISKDEASRLRSIIKNKQNALNKIRDAEDISEDVLVE
ncbi:MAG: CvpA family protein [Candidatus Jidaibacter sp.]|jgi:membrane protein required for colicin V production|nr:CvpA family protein [Candidatus Jidaibacter sp.]